MQINHILMLSQTAIFLGGLIVAIKQIAMLNKQIKLMSMQMHKQFKWEQQKVTFDCLDRYSIELKDVNCKLQKKLQILLQNGDEGNSTDILSKLGEDNTRAEIYQLVAFFEHVAIGIGDGYLDEDIIRKGLINVVISTYKSLKPYLLIRRDETGKMIGSRFERLALNWEEGKDYNSVSQ